MSVGKTFRSRRLRISLLVAVVAVASLASVIVMTKADAPLNSLAVPTRIEDRRGNPVLTIQLTTGRTDTGKYDLYVAGVGDYTGQFVIVNTGAPVSGSPPTIIVASTAGTYVLSGVSQATLYPDGGGTSKPAALTLVGAIQSDATGARAVLAGTRDGKFVLLIGLTGTAAEATVTSQQVIVALQAQDWTNLYGMLTLSLREKYTQAQFVTFMQSQPPHTTTSITLSGIGTVGTTEGGVTYFAQPITFVDEQRGTLHTTLYLVSEGGQWRFLSTSAV